MNPARERPGPRAMGAGRDGRFRSERPVRHRRPPAVLAHAHLGLLDYRTYLHRARWWACENLAGRLPDVVVTAAHPPVVTLGREAGAPSEELTVPAAELARYGVALHVVGRGGRATYHGPGQLVVYPVVDVRRLGLDPVDFANHLLEAARSAFSRLGLEVPCSVDRGLWVDGRKPASVGLEVMDGVTGHGLALNLEPERGPGFALVHPCGEPGGRVTDLASLTGRHVDRRALGCEVAAALAERLGLEPVPLAPEELTGHRAPWLVLRARPSETASGAGGVTALDPAGPPAQPTVCAAADCPNQARCRAEGRVTYLILGPVCTRACTFCRVPGDGRPRRPTRTNPGGWRRPRPAPGSRRRRPAGWR